MPRTLIGSIAPRRVSISFDALLVKVTASTPCGEIWPVWISHAMRVVSTRVLPLPAPARMRADWFGSVTAASCRSLRWARRLLMGAREYIDGSARRIEHLLHPPDCGLRVRLRKEALEAVRADPIDQHPGQRERGRRADQFIASRHRHGVAQVDLDDADLDVGRDAGVGHPRRL